MTRPARRALRRAIPLVAAIALITAALACNLTEGDVVRITATPGPDQIGLLPGTSTAPTNTPIIPTPNPPRDIPQLTDAYVVQSGDTLNQIAELYGTTAEVILSLNSLADPNVLEVGQTLQMPSTSARTGPDFKLIPDSELVFGPSASGFSVAEFIQDRQGFLNAYSEKVGTEIWSGVRIIESVALSYSVNPRLLLAILEYRSGWLDSLMPSELGLQYPMGLLNPGREGLYAQTLDMADALNQGYYGWKYRGFLSTTVGDTRVFFAATLNPGTVGVQYALGRINALDRWQQDVSPTGFFQTYLSLFGDPFVRAVEPLVPADLSQPAFALPFAQGEEWVYTGGPHGAYNSGSAWSAVDFAPPKPSDDLVSLQGSCYISAYWVTAIAPGVIARAGDGHVMLDLDGDGDEHTGWVIQYLHIDQSERVAPGTYVNTGDKIGHPSCEGGFSTGTHLHLSRRYNGEWIPVECTDCAPGATAPSFVLSGWTMYGYTNQEYQGYMIGPGDAGRREADADRDYLNNKVIW